MVFLHDPLAPCSATVCYVHSDGTLNLSVLDHTGGNQVVYSVQVGLPGGRGKRTECCFALLDSYFVPRKSMHSCHSSQATS